MRRVLWRPPSDITVESVSEELRALGAREWQIAITAPILTEASLNPQPLPPRSPKSRGPRRPRNGPRRLKAGFPRLGPTPAHKQALPARPPLSDVSEGPPETRHT